MYGCRVCIARVLQVCVYVCLTRKVSREGCVGVCVCVYGCRVCIAYILRVCVCVYVCEKFKVLVCVCVYVCLCKHVCVCVCVCIYMPVLRRARLRSAAALSHSI